MIPNNKSILKCFVFWLQAERDRLTKRQHEMQRRMENRDMELHEKEEELFLQLEKAIRLEEDCEKVTSSTTSII